MSTTFNTTNVASPIESEVRSYSRIWPEVFERAKGSAVWSDKREFLDFFSAAGSLNYGHNDPDAQAALTDYIGRDGILQALDMQTVQRQQFLSALEARILQPRQLHGYRVMFTGPTGTNAIEAALKCARLSTGRTEVVSFLRGFHGVSLGSLSASSNASKRRAAGVPLRDVSRFPFDIERLSARESIEWFERIHFRGRPSSEFPACVLMELVQGEGGVNVAGMDWAQGIAATCRRYDVPLVVDEIQTGCGRTGPFFAFEDYEVKPDIIAVSKSLSGLGLPLSVVLLRPDLDMTTPGQHNGTFRGNNAAFVTATTCLEKFWTDDKLSQQTRRKSDMVHSILADAGVSDTYAVRGRGLVIGIDVASGALARRAAELCFERGLLVETAGTDDQVVKLLPPLTTSDSDLARGVEVVAEILLDLR
ncbi:diaminobutyrate--2-oxoglutarate transaminase [Janibacter melonis]|uniref:diaminobutyrate--2-oxoglutarate transaminase n=1 Tax=Janibacter melonis TaxID=262209 RepID=UPI0020448956|nr:diaminobutyrate--2-oxoglutarate transaminase [Janibacter melonis]MCM3556832.1 diaminobutyrate--2-oxoglutarate transaminase [Janibacter melonis]